MVITLEHGKFKWTISKYYREVLSLRRELMPLRDKLKRRLSRRDILPTLLNLEDLNVRQGTRLRKQVPKVQGFLNAVVSSRTYRSHPATARFFEISRISFIKDTGPKKKLVCITSLVTLRLSFFPVLFSISIFLILY
ncbi:Phospholipase D1 [Geodia barretti]|uniref:Phospholipase D1 n=1 Tax=Geodia barretti TaxID=519541 RepID=A0AA35W9V2_GEOBA|nr:Phospholipase D1 [Geodia barretti]